ncbi:hypothetical protein ACF0H5_001446 [Mactra antiquata]
MGKKKTSGNITLVNNPKVINVDYQLLSAERDDLLEAEIGYKRRIEELEKETADALKSFDILYNENKILRSKLETPDGVIVDSIESYNTVFKDREHLREANKAFKRRIRQLEDDAEEAQKSYNKLYQNHQLVTQKAQLETQFATKARDEKITDMEKEHEEMTERLRMFTLEKEQFEYRIAEMDKERNELQNKHDFLAEEKHEFQLRCDVLQADREKLKEKIMNLEDKIPDPEQKSKEEQHLLSLQGQLAALQVSNTDASREIFNLKEQIRALNKQKKEPVDLTNRATSPIVDEDEEDNEKQKEIRYAEVEKELAESKKNAIRFLSENDELKSLNAELDGKLANSELRIDELNIDLNKMKTEMEDMSVLIQGGKDLNHDYVVLQEQVKDLSAARQALENELIQEKKMSKLKQMDVSNELKIAQDKINEIDKERMKQESDNSKIQNENDALQKVTEAQALELRNMKAQLEQMQIILEDKNAKYEEIKKTDKEAQEELRNSRLQLHIARRELDDLRLEKHGNYGKLEKEIELAKAQREEETEQMRKETIHLREEVKRLKDYEFKITTMDSEIRRLMNRLRVTERYRRMPKKSASHGQQESEEMTELKKKHKVLERENITLMQERRQWEILRNKYAELQKNNRRLVEENKRVRGDLDGSTFKVDALEKKFKKMNMNVGDEVEEPNKLHKAVYVEKCDKREPQFGSKRRHVHFKEKKASSRPSRLEPLAEEKQHHLRMNDTKTREKRRKDKSQSKSSEKVLGMRSKKPVLPNLDIHHGLKYGKGYGELHKNRYRPGATLALL